MKNKIFFSIITCFLLLLTLSGCEVQEEPVNDITPTGDELINKTEQVIDEPVTSEPVKAELSCKTQSEVCVVDANNEFAFDMYDKITEEDGNQFFSPWSISTALAMTYEGARDNTAEEMADVLNMVEKDDRLKGFQQIIASINEGSDDFTLSTANALWAQVSYRFLDEYFDLIDQYYSGKVTNLDFVTDTEKSRQTINGWVEDNTNGKIKDLIPKGLLNSMTRLVLTNAVYFKGTWVLEFDKDETKDAQFNTGAGSVTVDMMQRTDEEALYNYYEDDDFQVIEMPYKGDRLSMFVVLPREVTSEISFRPDDFKGWKGEMTENRINVYFPKFKFETKYLMKDMLLSMGIKDAFSGSADFSGMTGMKDLFISQVIHQAFVDVNEEGTEAAAATAVIMDRLAEAVVEPIPVFRADHPFVFIIQDKETGSILFMGKVVDPNA